jgi:hypothetical protein
MIVDDICQVIGGEAVGFQQHGIGIDIGVSGLHRSEQFIPDNRGALQGHPESNYRGFPLLF